MGSLGLMDMFAFDTGMFQFSMRAGPVLCC